jgi:leucyl aminopeptidase
VAIADFARDIAALNGNMECHVLAQKECEDLHMGGFLAVQQGSKFPPQFVHMIYKNKNTQNGKKIAIIGKGLTFDSGGYNLKVTLISVPIFHFLRCDPEFILVLMCAVCCVLC